MSDKFRSMQVFVVAAAAESFADAAQELDISAVMVGKHVRALEEQLGARLLERTTRRQTLTEIGAAYLERCRDVLQSMEAADHVAETLRELPQGTLRISATVTYGTHRLVPLISEYAALHPRVAIDLVLNDRVVDMAEEGIDVAIRLGAVQDDGLIARPLRNTQMHVVASPAYLARHGVPAHPSDLKRHNCLSFAMWGPNYTWRFTRGSDTVQVPVRGGFVCNNGEALLSAALAGMGVIMQTDALLESTVASGQLSPLLTEWELPSRTVHILRRPETRPSAKVRSFVDFVVSWLG